MYILGRLSLKHILDILLQQNIFSGFTPVRGYDHVVLLLALIKLDYNLTSMSWLSSSGLRGRRRTYLTILKRTWSAHSKMVRYVLLRPLRPELECQDVDVRL
jgi:hypothetical protein